MVKVPISDTGMATIGIIEARQDHRLEHGVDHRLDRLRDEHRRVVDDVVLQALGEGLGELRHRRLHLRCGGESIGARPLEDTEWDGDPLVEITAAVVVGGAKLDTPHVAHADDAPVGVGLDDDVAELRRISQAPLRLDVELEGTWLRHRRLIDHPGGDLHVLGTQRGDHVARG
jgi:hypothetical protein